MPVAINCTQSKGLAFNHIVIIIYYMKTVFLDFQSLYLTLAMTGKFFISVTGGMILVYTTEVFPTCVRNQGTTIASLGKLTPLSSQ